MAKISENSITVLNYLKANAGKKLTSNDVADATGLSVATVNGVFTSLSNKKLGYREDAEVPGSKEISFLGLTEDGKTIEVKDLSENAQKIIEFFKSTNDDQITADDAAEALGIGKRQFIGAFNGLVKKSLAFRTTAKVEAPQTVKYLVLTDAGMAYVPETDAE